MLRRRPTATPNQSCFLAGGEYYAVPDHASINIAHTDSITLGYYANPQVTGSPQVVMSKMTAAFQGWAVLYNGNAKRMVLYLCGTNGSIINGYLDADTCPLNEWHHWIWTYPGTGSISDLRCYKDGVSQTINTGDGGSLTATTSVAENLRIGFDDRYGFGLPYNGYLDEPFFVKGTAITSGQAATLGVAPAFDYSALAYYANAKLWHRCGDLYVAASSTIEDQTTNNNDGTFAGGLADDDIVSAVMS